MSLKRLMLDGETTQLPVTSKVPDEKDNEKRLVALHDILTKKNNEDAYYPAFGFPQFHVFSAEEIVLLKSWLDHDIKLCNDLWGRSEKHRKMLEELTQEYTSIVNKFSNQGSKNKLDKIIEDTLQLKLTSAIKLLLVSGGDKYTLRYLEIDQLSQLAADIGIPPATSPLPFNFLKQLETICSELDISIPETGSEFIRCVREQFGSAIIQTQAATEKLIELYKSVQKSLAVLSKDESVTDDREPTERDILNLCKKAQIKLRAPGTAFTEDYLPAWIHNYAPEGTYSSDSLQLLSAEAEKKYELDPEDIARILSDRELVLKPETIPKIPFFTKYLYVLIIITVAMTGAAVFLIRLLNHLADILPFSTGLEGPLPGFVSMLLALSVSAILFLVFIKLSGLSITGKTGNNANSRISSTFMGIGLIILATASFFLTIRIISSSNLGWMIEDLSIIQNQVDARIIPAGSFIMGSDTSGWDDQAPAHHVEITTPILVRRFEENNFDVKTVLGSKKVIPESEKNMPARNISWTNALVYCNELSRKDKLTPVYDLERNKRGEVLSVRTYTPENGGWRLPTEEEWEYISKRGEIWKSSIYPRGYQTHAKSGGPQSGPAGINEGISNILGIYHLGGNVMEWCFDRYGVYLDKSAGIRGYSQATKGDKRVVRGGSWATDDMVAEIGYRNSADPTQGNEEIGLRLVRTLK